MAVPSSRTQREYEKFIEDSGDVCLRIVQTTAVGTSADLLNPITDREYGKFVEDINGDVAIVILAV
jgi:hypothetical protein